MAFYMCMVLLHIHHVVIQCIYCPSLLNKTCQLGCLGGIGQDYSYFVTDNTVIFPNLHNFYDNHVSSNQILF